MNRDEFNALLIRVQVLDNRQVDRMTAEAWWPILGALPYSDALDALNSHFRDSPDVYLKPGHIAQGARRIRAERAPHYDHSQDDRGNAPKPQNMAAMAAAWDDPEAWRAQVNAYNDQLRESQLTHYVLDEGSSERDRRELAAPGPNHDRRATTAVFNPRETVDFSEARRRPDLESETP